MHADVQGGIQNFVLFGRRLKTNMLRAKMQK